MKTLKKFLLLTLIAYGAAASAQITLQSKFKTGELNSNMQWIYLNHSGYKFIMIHSDTLDIFNLNYSLFKRIFVPSYFLAGNTYIEYVSEGLFDTDTLHIDYMLNSINFDSTSIYNENGNLLYKFDSLAPSVFGDALGISFVTNEPIFNSDSGTFLIMLNILDPSNSRIFEIFKLPGSLPCIPGCTGGNTLTNSAEIPHSNYGSNVFPNPAVSYTNIYYNLPAGANEGEIILYDLSGREVKQYAITPQFDHLRLTTSDIKAGTYCYRIICNGQSISSKKIIIVK